jgi:iron(III) transport system permease protein
VLTSIAQSLGFVAPDTPVDWFGSARIVGIILVEALSLYPILYLNVSAALANLDPALEQAAANLGASRWTIFRKITLPLMRPGLFAGGTIVLIWSFTELGTPLMFDFYDVTPVQIFHRLTQVTGNPLPYALVVVMLMSVSGVGAWYQSAIPKVFTADHYAHALTHDFTMPSVRNSVAFASASMALDIVIGLIIAWLIVRSALPGRRLIDSLAMLPLAVPGVVLAFGYLAISLELQSWIGRDRAWLRDLVDVQQNPTVLLVVAYAMRRLPYVVRSAVAGLEQTPVDLELAARNLGASGFFTLRRITIPLIAANLLAGGLLAFAFAMLEVSDSLILAQRQTYWPITKAIYELFQRLGDGPYIASALGVWAMALLTLTILSANAFLGKRMGAIFRV